MIFKDYKYYNIEKFSMNNINTNDKRLSNLCRYVNILSKFNNILFIELNPYKKLLYKSICNTSLRKSDINYKQLPEEVDLIETIEDNRRNLDMIFIYVGRNNFDIDEFENTYNLLYGTQIFIISHGKYKQNSIEINEDNISGINYKEFEKMYKRSFIIKGINDIDE